MKHYVYAIHEMGREKGSMDSPVKIGVATNVWKRRDVLQTGNPRQLTIQFYLGPFSRRQAYEIEKGIHEKYSMYQKVGEWFHGKVLKPDRLLKWIRINQWPVAYSIGGYMYRDLECLITEQDEKPAYRVACQ